MVVHFDIYILKQITNPEIYFEANYRPGNYLPVASPDLRNWPCELVFTSLKYLIYGTCTFFWIFVKNSLSGNHRLNDKIIRFENATVDVMLIQSF